MAYPEMLVAPMRQQLESAGFKSLMNSAEVETALSKNEGTQLLRGNGSWGILHCLYHLGIACWDQIQISIF